MENQTIVSGTNHSVIENVDESTCVKECIKLVECITVLHEDHQDMNERKCTLFVEEDVFNYPERIQPKPLHKIISLGEFFFCI